MSASEKATFGTGCFWGTEETFRQIPGVTATRVGYAGGTADDPTYEQVCTGRTGHAEVVEVSFDPQEVSYEVLLETFWESHDPTQVDRQGPDIGTQYRSVVFVHDETQREAAETSRRVVDASSRHGRKVATRIEPAGTFWPAEEYHQRYLMKRGRGQCHI